jgi:hypothetical protein
MNDPRAGQRIGAATAALCLNGGDVVPGRRMKQARKKANRDVYLATVAQFLRRLK